MIFVQKMQLKMIEYVLKVQSRKIWHSRIVAKLKTIWSTNSRLLVVVFLERVMLVLEVAILN